ncbi:MAG: hypothetical protein ACYSWQ_10835 [Planctomycetota bacterium]|jgi:hypothetical protein
MKTTRIIILVLSASILSTSLWSCAKKEQPDTDSEPNSQSSTDDSQIVKPVETTSQASTPDIPAKADKEVGKDSDEELQRQIGEVRKAFISLQDICKANDIDGYTAFWDDETKMVVDGRDLDVAERRENRRKSLTKSPGRLHEIANAKIESITVDTSQAKKIEDFWGVKVEGTLMLVRTDGRAYLFHETAAGWKLFTVAPADYFR